MQHTRGDIMATPNQQDVHFVLERASADWHYLAWIIAAIIVLVFVIRRYGPKPPGPWAMISTCCRCLGMLIVLIMLAGPAWETIEHHVQPGQVTIAVDLSQSMDRKDHGDQKHQRASQASALFRALEQRSDAPNNTYQWKSICANGTQISIDDLRNNSLVASGTQSRLAHEITQIASSSQQDVLVVVSDGRSTDNQQLESVAKHLRERDISLYVLATGSDAVQNELHIAEVIGNREIALGERQPFSLSLDTRGLIGSKLTMRVHNASGDLLKEKEIVIPGDEDQKAQLVNTEATIDVIMQTEGEDTLRFSVEGEDGIRAATKVKVHISERKLRVLMLAHHPRYEMRYLRNALDRDHTVVIHSYLADGRWRRWGTDRFGPAEIPLNSEALKEYDAVILGDVSAHVISIPIQENIVKAVRQSGLGLIWVPGERGAIADYRGSALGKLIPADIPDRDTIQRGYLKGILHKAKVTPVGQQFLKSGKIDWEDLPELIGNCPLDIEKKKGIQVLMTGTDDTPLVISRQFSAGKASIIAVDDTWRWRKNVGDFYLHRFYSSLLRYTSSGRQLHRKPWQITSTPSRARLGEAVQITVSPTGPITNQNSLPDSITVQLQHGEQEKIIRLHRAPDANSYGISTAFFQAGNYQLNVADGINVGDVRSSELTILNATAENSDPRISRDALDNLAAATGARVYDNAEMLAKDIPDRQRRRSERRVESVWDSLWLLIAAITLFCFEWAIRRHFRLP